MIIWIGDHDRAVFHTGGTTRAFLLYDVSGLLDQGYPKVSCFTFYTVNFGIGEDLDIGMPADLDQFRRENSHGAVIGGKGLVQLGHVPADGRGLLHQIHPVTRCGKIKSGLNTADPPADHHHIPEMAVSNPFTKLLNLFLERAFFFHFV